MRELWHRLIEPLWALLPDKCQMSECRRNGVRGNENVIDGKILCDDCSVWYSMMKEDESRG